MAKIAVGSAVEAYFVKLGAMLLSIGMRMELRHLRYFIAVAEARSLTVAAQRMLSPGI
jgi:LysR family hca operon transcriptional activator